MQPSRRKLLKYLLLSSTALVVLLAAVAGAFGVVVARVPAYRVQLQEWISNQAGVVIEFKSLSARFRLYGPELVFDEAVVRTPDRSQVLASARRGTLALDLGTSFSTGRIKAGRFALDGPELGLIRTEDGRFQLAGQSALPDRASTFTWEQLPIGSVRVTNAKVSFRDEVTGRGPWSLSGVNFELEREPAVLRLRGAASLPSTLGQTLKFSARSDGPLEQSANVLTSFTLEGSQLDLGGWADLLDNALPAPESGRGSMKVNGTMRGAAISSLSAKVDFTGVATLLPAWVTPLPTALPLVLPLDPLAPPVTEPPPPAPVTTPVRTPQIFDFERIACLIKVQRRVEGWQVMVSDVNIARTGSPWHASRIQAQWTRNAAGEVQQVTASADRMVLQNIWPLLAHLPESERVASIRSLRATGEVEDLSFTWQRGEPNQSARYSLQATFENTNIEPVQSIPGLKRLSGKLQASEAGGQFLLDAPQLELSMPHIFRGPVPTNSVRGRLAWQQLLNGIRIETNQLRIDTPDVFAQIDMALSIPNDGSSKRMDLTAQLRNLEANQVRKYLPVGKMGTRVVEWLDRALVAGRLETAVVDLHGPLDKFPFRNGGGQFLGRGHIVGMTLNYQPGWAPAVGLSGDIEFRDPGLYWSNTSAKIGGMNVTESHGDFADFKAGIVKIYVTGNGDLDAGLSYLQNSPAGPGLGPQLRTLRGRGPIQTNVQLMFPLKEMLKRRIDVTTRFDNASVTLAELSMLPFTQINGSLTVRQTLPEAGALKAQWLGGSVDIGLQPERDLQQQSATLTVLGRTAQAPDVSVLLPSVVRLGGNTDWRMKARLVAPRNATESAIRTVRIDSNLAHLRIDMPYPVGKWPDETRSFGLDVEYLTTREILARATLGDMRALARYRVGANGRWGLDRGGVRADAIPAALPAHRGLRIEGSLDRLMLDDWFDLRLRPSSTSGRRLADSGKPTQLSELLRAVNLRVGKLQLFGFEWPDVRGLVQAEEATWRVDLAGPNMSGQMIVPQEFNGVRPLIMRLDKLVATPVEISAGAPPTPPGQTDPRAFPSLNVRIGDLWYQEHALGALELQANKVDAGLRFDVINLEQPSVRVQGRGQWLMTPQGPRSTLSASMLSSDMEATLQALNYPKFMAAKRVEMKADLNWPGGYDRQMLSVASGSMVLDVQSGQLLSVQPGAGGRVLGLLSIAALPRRLTLDFSDLTDKGLGFDSIHGDFELREGNAFTNNLLLRGPAVEIGIAGRTGLGSRDYEQTAVVTGSIGSTLPVAGAIAGGPAIGAALYLFSRVFKEPLKGIARGYYRIGGTWDNPQVERMDAAQAREATNPKEG
jgi:uncharacterized protein (TIGR02099 family)